MSSATTGDGPGNGGKSLSRTRVVELVGEILGLEEDGEEYDLLTLAEGDTLLASEVERMLATTRKLPALQAAATGSRDPWAGRVLDDRHRIVQRLGAGAMGVVYEAYDSSLGRAVAIKVLRSAVLDHEGAAARFEREAEVLASVRHPAVVTLYDQGATPEGDVYLVMELLRGMPLVDALEEQEPGQLPDPERLAQSLGREELGEESYLRLAVRWTMQLAAGLDAVHGAGCFHRDVKPSNVILCRDGRAVLVDFGIATRPDDAKLTREGSTVGTPTYLAPECLEPGFVPATSQDVYGLTATLYHLVTGQPPYTGSPAQVMTALATREPVPAGKLRPELPRDLQAILECGLDRNLDRRYSTARELGEDLKAFLEHRPVSARRQSPLMRGLRTLTRSRTARGAAAAAVVLAVVLAGLGLRSSWLAAKAERYQEAWSHVLFLQTLSEVDGNRVHALPGSDERQLAALDAAVTHATSPVPSRLVRSAFLLDHGDVAGAARDMQTIASVGPFTGGLADQLAALPEGTRGDGELDLAALPDPVGAEDKLVTAYTLLRAGYHAVAFELLDDEELDGLTMAEELRFLYRPYREGLMRESTPLAERAAGGARLQEDLVRFEESIGGPTALTAHLRGLSLDLQMRWEQALEAFDLAIALAPDGTSHRQNAALSAFRSLRFDEVATYIEPIIERLPDYVRPQDIWLRSLLEAGQLDAAEELFQQMPWTPRDATTRTIREAAILSARAREQHTLGELEAAKHLAAESLELIATLDASDPERARASHELVSQAILDGDENRLLDGLLLELELDPVNPYRLDNLLEEVPEQLDTANRQALFDYLKALHSRLADPGSTPGSGSR